MLAFYNSLVEKTNCQKHSCFSELLLLLFTTSMNQSRVDLVNFSLGKDKMSFWVIPCQID